MSNPRARTISDYTPEEVAAFQASYRPLVAEYRRQERIGRRVSFALLVCVIAGVLAPKSLRPVAFIVLFAVCLPAGTLYVILSHRKMRVPDCPGCGNRPDRAPGIGFGSYCPECGRKALQPARREWLGYVPGCGSCGRSLGTDEGARSYKIRFCTHCGLMLDERGL